ncbi:MAG TPA: ABC transporter ATP-binding protein [Alphaproteobacteria bacterium]|nr:ABC transporter ATP-binding protein [Alphaproteobacteria bacterium]
MSLLEVHALTKAFGGVHAVADLTFTVEPGRVHSIIGPNGAGKTTLFNLITGLYTPTAGRIVLDGEEITALPTAARAAKGIGRTFQNLQIFFNMRAIENVMVGRHLHAPRALLSSMLQLPVIRRANRDAYDRAAELMRRVGLAAFLDSDADAMPYGALKRLEIARALAAEPKVLLLDEPAAGLNPKETQEIDDLIKSIAAMGTTVVLVEHNMKLVMGVSDHILVLDYGRRLAEGTAADVRNNPDVIRAYLGAAAALPR